MTNFVSFIVITLYLIWQQVIKNSKTEIPELELFPRYLLFLRQQPATRTQQSNIWVNMGMMSLRMFPQHLPRGNLRMQQEYHAFVETNKQTKPKLLEVWCHCTNTHSHLLSFRISKSSMGLRSMVMRKTRWGSGKISAANWEELFLFLASQHTKKINRNIFHILFFFENHPL